MDVGISF